MNEMSEVRRELGITHEITHEVARAVATLREFCHQSPSCERCAFYAIRFDEQGKFQNCPFNEYSMPVLEQQLAYVVKTQSI